VTIQVPSEPADRYPIVVGVDGSPASLAALRWAVQDATAHAAPLWIVHVLDPRERRRAPYAPAANWDDDATDAVAIAEELIERDAAASVQRIFEVGPPARMLLRHCADARLLVLGHNDGHRWPDPTRGYCPTALGPTARACVQGASCPVLVVPVPAPERAEGRRPPKPFLESASGPPVEGRRALFPRHDPAPATYR
jgi:nucleotide-binding universal stress UspA family protein